ncbi:hypothetical protein BH09ACT10_BH09ACT10_24390 [soil metagenome]
MSTEEGTAAPRGLGRMMRFGVDMALGSVDIAAGPIKSAAKPLKNAAGLAAAPAKSALEFALHPPLVPDALSPGHAVDVLAERGRAVRESQSAGALEAIGSVLENQMPQVTDALVSRMDLTDLLIANVDLARLVEAVLDHLDLTELVRSRVDLAGLTSEVIDEIDLPAIIRESTTGVAADVVTGARASAAGADDAVARFLARFGSNRRPNIGSPEVAL